jgi:hypothetical protein
MTDNNHPNFIHSPDNTRLMRIAIGACLSVTLVMVWAMVWGGDGGQKAQIADNVNHAADATSEALTLNSNQPKPISDNTVVSVVSGQQGDSVQYYEAVTGRSFQTSLRTLKTTILSDKRLPGFVQSYWSPSGRRVVSVFEEKGGLVLKSFDYGSSTAKVVGISPTVAAFSPDDSSLAYFETDPQQSGLYVSAADGSDARKILATRMKVVTISWPMKDSLAVVSQKAGNTAKDLSFVGLDGSLRVMLSGRENLEYKLPRSNKIMLFSFYDQGKGIQLWIVDMDTENAVALNVQTSAAKCAWTPDESAVICGIPQKDALVSDVAANDTATVDDIVRIDITTGEQTTLYKAQKDALMSVSDPLISSSGNYFVFRNLFDQRLYSFEMK